MKKLLLPMLVMAMSLMVAPTANAQSRQMKKEMKKEYTKRIKAFNKDGWKLAGSARTIEVELLKHYERLEKDGVSQVTGVAESSIDNVGRQRVIASAAQQYALSCGQHIRGRMIEDMNSNLSDEAKNEFDNFYSAYESKVEKEIKGELQMSFMVKRQKEKGSNTYQYEGYFTVDEVAASKARMRAFEQAAKESAAAQKYADRVSKFVQEAFDD
ncbi:MAG: hypothetical protein IJV22_04295 [Bacteroidales bacterium]|nr:hypothetical protein [Bacteroidales bacterium]